MCRKKDLHGCCLGALGFGMLVGHSLDSWFLCLSAGIGLLVLGFCVIHKK